MNRKTVGYIASGAVAVVLGIIILTNSSILVTIIMIAAGLAALLDGIYTLRNCGEWGFSGTARKLAIAKGLLLCVLGLMAVFMPLFVAETAVRVVSFILALGLLFSAFVSFQNAVNFRKENGDDSVNHFYIEGAVSAALSLLLFFDPTAILRVAATVLGLAVTAGGIILIVWAIRQARESSEDSAENGGN